MISSLAGEVTSAITSSLEGVGALPAPAARYDVGISALTVVSVACGWSRTASLTALSLTLFLAIRPRGAARHARHRRPTPPRPPAAGQPGWAGPTGTRPLRTDPRRP